MNLIKKLLCSVSAVAVSAFLAVPVMAADAQWKRNDKGWWYEEANGAYPTNQWKLINNKWYYFDNIGYMLENRWVGNYYVGADGAMLVSTSTPDGYYVDATGKWVEGIKRSVNISKRSGTSSGGGRSGGSSRSSGRRSSGGGRSSGGSSSGSGSSGGSSSSGSSGSSSGAGSSGSASTNTNNAGSNTNANTTGSNHQVVTPNVSNNNNANTSTNTGNTSANTQNNNVANTGNNNTPSTVVTPSASNSAANTVTQVSSEETRVIDALKAMGVSEKEAKLYYIINAYRESQGLQKLSFSKSLTIVARTHVSDSNTYTPEKQRDSRGMQGNLHSWSNHGSWTPVVYTSDHEYAANMWSKPRELTSYTGNGYEISSWYSGNITPEDALDLWKNSSGHNAVMTTQGNWSDLKTMGVAIDGRYAHVWFGSAADPAGYYDVANYQVLHP
ncbi:CAP domain-containing protein [Lachnoanaerobaculum saburreum]|uniref:Cell wall-binding repeat protein n=1 Tax=Lachnoanaerobaculum saburreum TaxID=467210 RepID=A0A133ZH92_9FIRM|nr:CAP domain-containing protein [Lachnoanaerobaculum saburreum]KXB54809.1 cell wall-binding repeat protein [Lachnoanaerobaculum saburreum]